MSAWTWTSIKIDAVDKEMGLQYCNLAEKDMNGIWYYKNWLDDPNTALLKWKEFQLKEKKYFVEECGVPESHFTDEYMEKDFTKHIDKFVKLQDYINRYRNDEISFKELVDQTAISERHHCGVTEYNGDKYIDQNGEIFRLRQYDTFDLNLHTVEDLIEYLRANDRQQNICDFAVENCPYEGLTDALAKRIREHYGKIGDNNFIVNFG